MTSDHAFQFNTDFSAHYDALVRQAMFGYEQLFPLILAWLAPQVGEKASVLVVGSGTGMELVTFGRRMPAWTLTGVDPAEQMIRLARARLDNQNLSGRVRLHHGSLDTLPGEQDFDAATLVLVLHFLPDDGAKLGLLRGIYQRLRPGGGLALVDLGGDPVTPEFQVHLSIWKNFQVQMGLPREEVEKLVKMTLDTQYFIPEARVRQLLAEAGFSRVDRFYQALLNSGYIALKE